MNREAERLKEKLIRALGEQGFSINPHIKPINNEKDVLRNVHYSKKVEQLKLHRSFIDNNFDKMQKYSINGSDVEPEKIDLECIEIKSRKSFLSKLFFWWNLIWWSLPYTKPIGRQMRFVVWDRYHDAPFGLIGLQSPPIRSTTRDKYLGLSNKEGHLWINQSMYGQRIGALPPYNDLLGGKMVAMALTSNEIREAYKEKYENKVTLLNKVVLPARLLFITTTSAFGKSSVYDRIRYKQEIVANFIGLTSGSGTFHIPQVIFEEILVYLDSQGVDVTRGYGTGPSRKLELVQKGLSLLEIPNYIFHNIKRGYYLFPNVNNLYDVLHENKQPIWHNRPLNKLVKFWKERYGIPRSKRVTKWMLFDSNDYFKTIKKEIY